MRAGSGGAVSGGPGTAAALARAVVAELAKLATLPAVALTVVGCLLAGGLVAATLAASEAPGLTPATVVLGAVPFVQAGVVLLGVLPVGHEYAGPQHRTSLAAVPRRGVLLVARWAATALVLTAVAATTVLAAHAVAAAFLGGGTPAAVRDLVGAATYLVLIGLLAHATTVALRHLVPALVTVLTLVLVLSPVLAGVSEHARWLPDRAAAGLYGAGDPTTAVGTGALVALGWIAGVGIAGAFRFRRADA